MARTPVAPVVLCIYHRPEFVSRVMAPIRAVQPSVLLVVADGPRPGDDADRELCERSRAIATSVDWPCEVITEFADTNLGCDRRIETGIEWAFSVVDRAIVIEDDIVTDPSWFGWATAMLERFAADPDVSVICARNDLVSWGAPDVDHLVGRRCSIYGWATWADRWQRLDRTLAGLDASTAPPAGTDPLFAAELVAYLALDFDLDADPATPSQAGWDIRFMVARAFEGGFAVSSPVNLAANIGFGAQASRTVDGDVVQAAIPVGRAPTAPAVGPLGPYDPSFDRASVLIELAGRYRNPEMAKRLARTRRLLRERGGEHDAMTDFVLTAFDHPDETRALIDHLRANGVQHERLERLAPLLEP
jgi:hypothetical protein